jgi:hypothetical protein
MKKHLTSVFFTILLGSTIAYAQDYKTGIGIRGGWTGGITLKHFVKEGRALEGIFSTGWHWRGYRITGLYEIHKAAFAKENVAGLFWFYGAGAHFGGYSYQKPYYEWQSYGNNQGYYSVTKYKRQGYVVFGIDGVFGLEYKIEEIPITLSLDVKPFIEFSDYQDYPFHFWDAGFSLRYVF